MKKYLLAVLLSVVCCSPAIAFDTKKPISVIIPFSAGGGTDAIFRKFQKFAAQQNITMTPIYKPGAQGVIGLQTLYEAKPDGYTIALAQMDTVTMFSYKNQLDVNGVFGFLKGSFGIVTSNKNESLKDLVTTKSAVKIGYTILSQKAIVTAAIKMYGSDVEQIYVPYKSGNEMLTNVINGDIDIGITSLSVLAPMIKSNKLKLIGVDSVNKFDDFPSALYLGKLNSKIPAIGKGTVLLLPADATEQVRKFWEQFIAEYLSDPQVRTELKAEYMEPMYKTKRDIQQDLLENAKILQE